MGEWLLRMLCRRRFEIELFEILVFDPICSYLKILTATISTILDISFELKLNYLMQTWSLRSMMRMLRYLTCISFCSFSLKSGLRVGMPIFKRESVNILKASNSKSSRLGGVGPGSGVCVKHKNDVTHKIHHSQRRDNVTSESDLIWSQVNVISHLM